jgi:ADP-ribosylglycohydrolase
MKPSDCILGAFVGDIIGSAYEFNNVKSIDFEFFRKGTFFTDDSVLTAATMDVLLSGYDYADTYREYGQLYPHRGYGEEFKSWIYSDNPKPYNSWGNGSAMRVSPMVSIILGPDLMIDAVMPFSEKYGR